MPIKHISADEHGGTLAQTCAACGAEHTISFDRGAQKSRTGPVALELGATLSIAIDGNPPVTVMLGPGDLPELRMVTAAQLVAALQPRLPGARVRDDAGGLLIESETRGPQSRLEIVGGTACEALGFQIGERADPCTGRPVLGIQVGEAHDKDVIALRRCNDCGASECLVRTFDEAGVAHEATHFAEHRRAVNALAQHAKAQGWSHPAVEAAHRDETVGPSDMDMSFPTRTISPRPRGR